MRRAPIGRRTLRRVVRLLLPRAFAAGWGEEIVVTTLDRAADARAAGPLALSVFVAREIASLVVLAVRAHARTPRAASRRNPMLTDPEDNRRYRVAWAVALAVHFAAFLVVFPFGGHELEAAPDHEMTIITRYQPPKPPERVQTRVVKRRARAVPIPDPTPEEPEAIVSEIEEVYVEPEDRPDVEFLVQPPPGPPPASRPDVVRVGPGVERPEQLVRVQPEYPELARRARLECAVILETRIDRLGDVVDVRVLRGCGLGLDASAVQAVRQWKYVPTRIDGRPVEVAMTVTVVFRLR